MNVFLFAVDLDLVNHFVESFDWAKWAPGVGALVAVPVLWKLASGLARRHVEEELRNLRDRAKNADDARRIAEATLAANTIVMATRDQTIAFHEGTITQLQAEAKQKQAEYDKVFAAGQRLYKEVIPLRLLRGENDKLKQTRETDLETIRLLEDKALGTDEKLKALRDQLERREKSLAQGERRIRKAMKMEGFLWNAKPQQKWARAKPLASRKHVVISVLNLKGGVGKTTITAHLGATLARRGYKVLLVDLDLQGSLTSLLLPTTSIQALSDENRLVQDYLSAAATSPTTKLLEYVTATPFSGGKLDIIPTSDKLGYAEFNLTLRWLLREDGRDARFLLRRGVQRIEVGNDYDIVLVDCPPLFNMSCINALAASDYLLIPAAPSVRALERVPQLLQTIREKNFLNFVNFDLRVLGVVPNRTYRDTLTQDESRILNTWMGRMKSAMHIDVKQFAPIPQKKDAQTIGEPNSLFALNAQLDSAFTQLADEIEKELPNECRVVK